MSGCQARNCHGSASGRSMVALHGDAVLCATWRHHMGCCMGLIQLVTA